jgi:carbonic anhydrase
MNLLLLALTVNAWDYKNQGTDWPDTCSSGEEQSPIDLDTGDYSKLSDTYRMEVYYYGKTASRTVVNTGNVISMEGDFGYITIIDKDGDERKYLTEWVEFHMPSEHWFDGYSTDMEMQIFHRIDDSDYTVDFPVRAIVSVPIRPGDESYFMNSIDVYNLPQSGASNQLPDDSNINLLAIVDMDDDYYFYKGSLNKPTCDEDVLWYIFETKQWVSLSQMQNFKQLWITSDNFSGGKGNVRAIQDTNGRTLYYSGAWTLTALAVLVSWLF